MKSKKIIIFVTVIVIFFGVTVFLFDSFVSKIANEKVLELDLPDFITYGDVSVSSIGSQLIIKDVLIEFDNEDQTVYCDEIRIGTSYKEIFNIIKTKEFNELGSFDLEFKNIIVNSTDDNIFKHKIASYVSIEYDGTLTQEMVQNIEYEFPSQDQRLAVKVSDFNIPIEAGILQELIPNIKTDLSTDCKFIIAFSPTTKQIELQNLYVKNEYISTSLDLKLDYKGTKPDNMVPIKIDVNGKSNFDLDDMVLGDKDMSINMGKGSMNFAFFVDGNLDNMDEDEIMKNVEGEFDVSIKDFKIKPSNEIIRGIPGLKLKNNEITLKNIENDFKWDGRRLVNTLDVSSSLISINSDIDINLKFNRHGEPDIKKSSINKCLLRIGGLDKNLEDLVHNFENEMLRGKSLPRQGKDIVLNVTGTFANPNIEGLNLN